MLVGGGKGAERLAVNMRLGVLHRAIISRPPTEHRPMQAPWCGRLPRNPGSTHMCCYLISGRLPPRLKRRAEPEAASVDCAPFCRGVTRDHNNSTEPMRVSEGYFGGAPRWQGCR